MHSNKMLYSKLFALMLAGLFFGSSIAILAGNSSGDDEGDDFGVVLSIMDDEKTIVTGGTAIYGITIENTGTQDDSYQISLSGRDYGAEGVTVEIVGEDEFLDGEGDGEPVDLDELSILAGESAYLFMLITINAEQGSYEITIMAQSNTDENVWDAGKTLTHVIRENKEEYDFKFKAFEKELTTVYGTPAIFTMELTNKGTVEDTYTVSLEVEGDYFHVEAFLMPMIIFFDPIWPGPDGDPDTRSTEIEITLGPQESMSVALYVIVTDIRDGNDPEDPGTDPQEDPAGNGNNFNDDVGMETHVVYVTAVSHGDPALQETITTITKVKDQNEEYLTFTCYEPEMSIIKGGTAEYFIHLRNYGWSYADVAVTLQEYEYENITAELFLVAPFWTFDFDGNYGPYPGMMGGGGVVVDENGEFVYLTDDDIVWDDYGGLIPVDEDFTYQIAPYESVQFLLRITHNYEGEEGDITDTMFPRFYEISVTAETEKGFHETVMTTTEVIYQPSFGFEMWLREVRQVTRPYQPVEYIITLKNTGNVEEIIDLSLGGDAFGMEGVTAYLYPFSDWDWREPKYQEPGNPEWDDDIVYSDDQVYTDPIIVFREDGTKEYFQEEYPGYGNYDPNAPIWQPEPYPGDLTVTLGPGEKMNLALWVMITYDTGSYKIDVTGVIPDMPETEQTVTTETVMKEIEYQGFNMYAPVTEQTALVGENVDYNIHLSNPGYYTDEIILELGGEDLNLEGVDAHLYVRRNVYYYDTMNGEFLRKDNANFHMKVGNGIYDPDYESTNEFRNENPGYDESNMPWDSTGSSTGGQGNGNGNDNGNDNGNGNSNPNGVPADDEEFIVDNTGGIYRNYEYEYESYGMPDFSFNEEDWLVPLRGEEMRVTLGPFEDVWLVLRIVVDGPEDIYDINVMAHSNLYTEKIQIVATHTTIVTTANFGLDLFIGDPEHYTAYGVTTIYVFQLTNTGDITDTVLLSLDGADLNEPGVFVEIGVNEKNGKEPLPYTDPYDNFILPYTSSGNDPDDKYYYQQWAGDGDFGTSNDPFSSVPPEDPFQKIYATPDGELISTPYPGNSAGATSGNQGNGNTNTNGNENPNGNGNVPTQTPMWMNPVKYQFSNWDVSDGSIESRLDDVVYQESQSGAWCQGGLEGETGSPDYFDMFCGFIPYSDYGEKYVELEPGETVIVTMKLTIFDFDHFPGIPEMPWIVPEPVIGEDEDDERKDDDGQNDEPGKNDDPGFMDDGEEDDENENPDDALPRKDSYEITLVATSVRAPTVSDEAKTITHLYDEGVQEGIYEKKISGVFNVRNRMISHEILEEGFEIIPLVLESGKIEFRVTGEFPEGRLVILNIDEVNIDELGDFLVFFDELKIGKMDADKILDYTGNDAKYAIKETDNGLQLFVYIPHFSEHLISIQSVPVNDGNDSGFSGSLLIMGLIMGVVAGVFGLNYRQKKDVQRKKEFKLKLHEEESPKKKISETDLMTPITEKTGNNNGTKTTTNVSDDLDSLLNESLFMGSFERKD